MANVTIQNKNRRRRRSGAIKDLSNKLTLILQSGFVQREFDRNYERFEESMGWYYRIIIPIMEYADSRPEIDLQPVFDAEQNLLDSISQYEILTEGHLIQWSTEVENNGIDASNTSNQDGTKEIDAVAGNPASVQYLRCFESVDKIMVNVIALWINGLLSNQDRAAEIKIHRMGLSRIKQDAIVLNQQAHDIFNTKIKMSPRKESKQQKETVVMLNNEKLPESSQRKGEFIKKLTG